ncbi:MAG: DUF5671 domain-containing protein [Candidatus Omnitrophota bacterium]
MDTNNNAAKYAFFYMLSLVALIFMALSTGMIIFQIINKNIVDVINNVNGYSSSALKFAISALIVSAPIFFITMRQIYKSLLSGALDKDSGIRKWLSYFVLLVSSIVMIGWLISTVNSLLDGELTSRFVLKAITAIFIAAVIFTFYLYDIKRDEVAGKKDKVIQIYFYGALIIVVAAFIASLFYVESPKQTRDRKLDNAILNKFEQISSGMLTYYQDNEKLPSSLDELVAEFTYITEKDIINQSTKEKFGYKIIAEDRYELCANFRLSNTEDEDNKYDYQAELWPHDLGYQCLGQKVRNSENVKEPMRVPGI